MKTIKIWDIPEHIGLWNNQPLLEFDGNKTDLRLHTQESIRWYEPNEAKYEAIETDIGKQGTTGNGWTVYAWCDISGHDYWINNMGEGNYIQITVQFESESVLTEELTKIDAAVTALFRPVRVLPTQLAQSMTDLFYHHEEQPPELAKIIQSYPPEPNYQQCAEMLAEVQKIGYSFEYGLDAVPYDLVQMEFHVNDRPTGSEFSHCTLQYAKTFNAPADLAKLEVDESLWDGTDEGIEITRTQ